MGRSVKQEYISTISCPTVLMMLRSCEPLWLIFERDIQEEYSGETKIMDLPPSVFSLLTQHRTLNPPDIFQPLVFTSSPEMILVFFWRKVTFLRYLVNWSRTDLLYWEISTSKMGCRHMLMLQSCEIRVWLFMLVDIVYCMVIWQRNQATFVFPLWMSVRSSDNLRRWKISRLLLAATTVIVLGACDLNRQKFWGWRTRMLVYRCN